MANAPAKVSITPAIATATLRRLRSPNSLPTGLAAWGGIAGRLAHCQAMFAAVIGTRAQKTPRQPMTAPR